MTTGVSLRDILNRARWASCDLHALELVVVHRGAPGDVRTLSGSRVLAVLAAGIELAPDESDGETAFIPYHRFLSIRGPSGNLLWDKASGVSTAAPVEPELAPESATAPDFDALPSRAERADEEGQEVPASLSVVLRAAGDGDVLTIDGSAGEGGGQILRTALCLSLLTGTPFAIERIRARRKKPGLLRQHLTCVKAAAMVASAEVEGAALGSSRLLFRPRTIEGGDYELDIGSAGSAALVLQTLALPLAFARRESRVRVRGGTHARWAPIYPFLERAWLPLMRQAGAELTLELQKSGFYPAGGGELLMTCSPIAALLPLHLPVGSGEFELALEAIVSGLSESIARRELAAAAELLPTQRIELHSGSVRSVGPGNAVWLTARDRASGLSNVFSAIGEAAADPEELGRSVARAFLSFHAAGVSVEEHLADQVMLPIAVAGGGSFTTHSLSLHARTNIEVIHAFTQRRVRVWQLGAERYRLALGPP